ncbi:calcium/calmodulin-dependent protein kinase II inhibitor 2-like [Engraulis encrasicolus]|uniref:calcium/calmodulin-dependent protein kinase II inhibitor 2-like n=1 Tax=Engraulis encrasicolus TaxID=184585 RepID=UPI002FD0FD5D
MSEVLSEKMGAYGSEGDEGEHLAFTCRLQDTNNFFSGSQNGKRPPKLGQIGRSKRVIEDDADADGALDKPTEKSAAGE